MKTLIVALAVVYSSQSMASIVCTEKDSKLTITENGPSIVKIVLEDKSGVLTHFDGLKNNSHPYVKRYTLESLNEKALLAVSTHYETTESPCHGRRVCGSASFKKVISAELDFQGKLTSYQCYEN